MEPVTYWNKQMETLAREELEELQLQRFRERMQYVYERSPMYKRKYDEAGLKPTDIRTLDDIQNGPLPSRKSCAKVKPSIRRGGILSVLPLKRVSGYFKPPGPPVFP